MSASILNRIVFVVLMHCIKWIHNYKFIVSVKDPLCRVCCAIVSVWKQPTLLIHLYFS